MEIFLSLLVVFGLIIGAVLLAIGLVFKLLERPSKRILKSGGLSFALAVFSFVIIMGMNLNEDSDVPNTGQVSSENKIAEQTSNDNEVTYEEETTTEPVENEQEESGSVEGNNSKETTSESATNEEIEATHEREEPKELTKNNSSNEANNEVETQSKQQPESQETNTASTPFSAEESSSGLESSESQNIPREHGNALQKAESYLSWSGMSKQGLREQLAFEEFPQEAINYAMENIEVDWREQALVKAQNYDSWASMSDQGLIEQLMFEGFTQEQAQYALNNLE